MTTWPRVVFPLALAVTAGAAPFASGCHSAPGDKDALEPLPPHPPSEKPRSSGVYVAKAANTAEDDPSRDYLRFLADGTALSASSAAAPEKVAELLFRDDAGTKESDQTARGPYQFDHGTLHFVLSSKLGTVAYEGYVDGNKLQVRWKSAIDGVSEDQSYTFVPVEDEAAASSAPEGTAAAAGAESSAGAVKAEAPDAAWFCFRAAGKSSCAPSQEACDQVRTAGREAKDARCSPARSAFCRTSLNRKTGEPVDACYATMADCARSTPRRGRGASNTLSSCEERTAP